MGTALVDTLDDCFVVAVYQIHFEDHSFPHKKAATTRGKALRELRIVANPVAGRAMEMQTSALGKNLRN